MRIPIVVAQIMVSAFIVPSGRLYAADPEPDVSGASGATIEGVVIYESDRKRVWRYRRYYVQDRRKGHLAEAVVALQGIPSDASSSPARHKEWHIDQKEYRFIPETVAIRAGEQVTFTNSDPLLHDVTIRQRAADSQEISKQENFTLRRGEEVVQTYPDAGGIGSPLTLSCRFHGAMRGWIYVFDHPYFQVTTTNGEFRFDQVPPGKRELVMVHPAGALEWRVVIDVKPGEVHRIEIRVSPDSIVANE